MFGLGRLKRLVNNNLRRIVIGLFTVPIFYRLTKYAAGRYITYQTGRMNDMIRKFKKQQLFENMESTFNSTFNRWLDLMKQNIMEQLDAEMYTALLRSDPDNKLDHWKNLQILAFARVTSMLYGYAMLTILLRIQVNVISGLIFKQSEKYPDGLEESFTESNIDLEERPRRDYDGRRDPGGFVRGLPDAYRVTEELQQEYMGLTRYLCTDGIRHLCRVVKEKSLCAIGKVSLKKKLTAEDILRYLMKIDQYELGGRFIPTGEEPVALVHEWSPVTEAWRYMYSDEMVKSYFNPTEHDKLTEGLKDEALRKLMCETYDILTAEDTRTILKFLEIQGRNLYVDRVAEHMMQREPAEGPLLDPNSTESDFVQEVATPLAKLIPVMNSFIRVPNEEDPWAGLLISNESMKLYSANIFESYCNLEESN